jgi:hypothetical protein
VSQANVSEDFDMALRLLKKGWTLRYLDYTILYHIGIDERSRWATYSAGEFKEGVCLTIDDEVNRWMKYAYGEFTFAKRVCILSFDRM